MSGQWGEREGSVLRDLKNVIDDHVGWLATGCKVRDSVNQQAERQIAAYAGKNNQPGMQFLARHELAEVNGIFCYDHPILSQTTREYEMIWFAESAHVARVYRVMLARLIEVTGELR